MKSFNSEVTDGIQASQEEVVDSIAVTLQEVPPPQGLKVSSQLSSNDINSALHSIQRSLTEFQPSFP